MYVCWSISLLPSLLKLGQYRDISLPVWNIFLNFFGDIPWMFLHYFQIIIKILVCLLVLYLAYILTEIRPLYGYLLFWKSYLSDFFRHSLDVFILLLNNYKFLYVCQAVTWIIFLAKTIWHKCLRLPSPSPKVYVPTFSHLRFLLTRPQVWIIFPNCTVFFSTQAGFISGFINWIFLKFSTQYT